ncbi:hypothetical protein [Bradyrhizobium sp. I1.7.5]|uniref:hypothetical protein n=1 Tax=Bradyrhizobium sp. I1.7.5 TaxID=3156363 RepID=UPI003392FDBF
MLRTTPIADDGNPIARTIGESDRGAQRGAVKAAKKATLLSDLRLARPSFSTIRGIALMCVWSLDRLIGGCTRQLIQLRPGFVLGPFCV